MEVWDQEYNYVHPLHPDMSEWLPSITEIQDALRRRNTPDSPNKYRKTGRSPIIWHFRPFAVVCDWRRQVPWSLACENILFSSLFAAVDVLPRNVASGEERGARMFLQAIWSYRKKIYRWLLMISTLYM